jgi:transcriptional regulator NrdR family protein
MAKKNGYTREQIKKYKACPNGCPACHSYETQMEDREHSDDGKIYERIVCLGCGEEWYDVYVLKTIEKGSEDYRDIAIREELRRD